MPLYLTEADVAALLTPADALEAVEESFRRLAPGRSTTAARAAAARGGEFAVMPASTRSSGTRGSRATRRWPRRTVRRLALLDRAGPLAALIEADQLGRLRTGAASGVAAQYLARPGATSLGVIGCGWQAETQVAAIRAALPAIERVVATCRTPERLAAFCREARRRAGGEPAARRPTGRRRDGHDVEDPVLRGEWLRARRARLRGRRERRAGAGARQRGAGARGVRLLRLARAGEARVGRPDRAGGARRTRLARGARAPGGRRRRGAAGAPRTRTSSSSSRTGSPPGISRSARRAVELARERGAGGSSRRPGRVRGRAALADRADDVGAVEQPPLLLRRERFVT